MRIKTKHDHRQRIKYRIRRRLSGTDARPRLSVFRSLGHIYAQVVDDMSGSTIAAASSLEPALKGTLGAGARGGNIAGATVVGRTIAERLIERA